MVTEAQQTLTIDRLDRQLVHALVIDGRASFSRLAEVLGASEQTVARRYRRLRDAGALRVVVLPDPRRFAHYWIVRVHVLPQHAVAFAEAIARRPDVAWVGLIAGATEVTFAARARTTEERDALLLERLPHVRQVLGMTTAAVLHTFAGDPETEWRALDDPLDAAQVAALASGRRRGGSGPDPTPQDEPLLAALARDGRTSYAALAAATGDTEARVARRVETLLEDGAVIVDVEIANVLFGYAATTWLWLTVAPSALDAVGRQVMAHPEVAFVGATSGPANLAAAVTTRDTAALYAYLTERIGAISAVQAVEVAPILRRFKQAGTLLHGGRLTTA